MQVLLKCGKFAMGKLKSSFLCQVSFLTDPHCKFRSVGQGMKQTCGIGGNHYFKLNWYLPTKSPNLERTSSSEITFIRYAKNRKTGKLNNKSGIFVIFYILSQYIKVTHTVVTKLFVPPVMDHIILS